jgi:hypothetical protein
LQKKLDAAKARVAAGEPPPAMVESPLARTASNASAVAAAQGVDFQMQSLLAERDALNAEIPGLVAQRDGLQKQVEGVLPVRQDYEKLTGRLAGVQKARQGAAARLEQAPAEGAGLVVEPVVVERDSGLPAYPRVAVVYGVAILAAAGMTWVLGWVLGKMDRSLHSVEEAAGVLDVPIAGAVMELRTKRQEMGRRVWRGVVRPAVAAGLVVVMVGSGAWCYRHLADSGAGAAVQEGGAGL